MVYTKGGRRWLRCLNGFRLRIGALSFIADQSFRSGGCHDHSRVVQDYLKVVVHPHWLWVTVTTVPPSVVGRGVAGTKRSEVVVERVWSGHFRDPGDIFCRSTCPHPHSLSIRRPVHPYSHDFPSTL